MPKLCFKTRPASNTVQLVHHTYCAQRGRSRTITVGSLSTRADPADYAADLSLHSGITLTDSDHLAIAHWLTRFGNPEGLLKTAQTAGIAKQYKRGLAPEVTPEMGATPNQEDPAVD